MNFRATRGVGLLPRSGAKKLVGRKSRRAHEYRHAKPLIRAGSEPFCAAAGMRQYLPRTCDVPFQRNCSKDTPTPRLKSGAICLRPLATLLSRRDFRPTFLRPLADVAKGGDGAKSAFAAIPAFFAILAFFCGSPCLLPYLSALGINPGLFCIAASRQLTLDESHV
jgi:hypothetical protein